LKKPSYILSAQKILKPFATRGCAHIYAQEMVYASKGNACVLQDIMEKTAANRYDMSGKIKYIRFSLSYIM
jgi:hypothetical protein